MSSAHQVKAVRGEELFDDVLPEGEGDPSIVLPPADNVPVWVRPKQIAQ